MVVNKRADGGITALHMAALNGHAESLQLLLDLGACVTDVTVEDGTTIDLIGYMFLLSVFPSVLILFLLYYESTLTMTFFFFLE